MTTATLPATRRIPLLQDYIRPALFISELSSKQKNAVWEELVAQLAASKVTRHPEGVLDAVRHREAMGSTALGKGIAMPHARSTLVTERAVVVARSSKGVAFDSPDGKPAHLLFLIVAPPLDRDPVYLQVMADIVGAARLAKVRQRVLDAPDFKMVRRLLVEATRA
jgi:mannitol/fructose-specific phosphotransferase system IIA component (Ntr-type)